MPSGACASGLPLDLISEGAGEARPCRRLSLGPAASPASAPRCASLRLVRHQQLFHQISPVCSLFSGSWGTSLNLRCGGLATRTSVGVLIQRRGRNTSLQVSGPGYRARARISAGAPQKYGCQRGDPLRLSVCGDGKRGPGLPILSPRVQVPPSPPTRAVNVEKRWRPWPLTREAHSQASPVIFSVCAFAHFSIPKVCRSGQARLSRRAPRGRLTHFCQVHN